MGIRFSTAIQFTKKAMKILILNAGSSSLKFCLYELPSYTVITKGVCERIGLKDSFISIKIGDKNIKKMAILSVCGFSVENSKLF